MDIRNRDPRIASRGRTPCTRVVRQDGWGKAF